MARTVIPSYVSEFVVTAAHLNQYLKENEEAHWSRITSIYAGKISAAGVAIELPDGWTCTNVTTGAYQITHNLGDTGYVVVGSASYGGRFVSYDGVTSNDFILRVYTHAGAAENLELSFILIHHGAW